MIFNGGSKSRDEPSSRIKFLRDLYIYYECLAIRCSVHPHTPHTHTPSHTPHTHPHTLSSLTFTLHTHTPLHSYTLTHPQAEAAALATATTSSAGGTTGSTSGGHQPVEFNHAINYVNKIKVHLYNSFRQLTFQPLYTIIISDNWISTISWI